MSGIIPDWWQNPDFIHDEDLENPPVTLDAVSSRIDEWVNDQLKWALSQGCPEGVRYNKLRKFSCRPLSGQKKYT